MYEIQCTHETHIFGDWFYTNDTILPLPPCLANSLCHNAKPTCCDVLGNSCVLGQHQKSCGHSAAATAVIPNPSIYPLAGKWPSKAAPDSCPIPSAAIIKTRRKDPLKAAGHGPMFSRNLPRYALAHVWIGGGYHFGMKVFKFCVNFLN